MNESWWWIVAWLSAAAMIPGFLLGYWYRARGEARRNEERRLAAIRRKKAQLQGNGRRLPKREGAGKPIVMRKARIRGR